MLHYYLMAILLLMALGAIKINGWISAVLLVLAMLASSPMFELPSKKLKWAIVLLLVIIAIVLFPDIEQYREAFEKSLETAPIPPKN
jgi:hypothetical protein